MNTAPWARFSTLSVPHDRLSPRANRQYTDPRTTALTICCTIGVQSCDGKGLELGARSVASPHVQLSSGSARCRSRILVVQRDRLAVEPLHEDRGGGLLAIGHLDRAEHPGEAGCADAGQRRLHLVRIDRARLLEGS